MEEKKVCPGYTDIFSRKLAALGEQNKKLTDTCSVFTACNEDIYLVVGDAMNFKITTDSDLRMANALAELNEK